ncbi:uncharacterized protein Eint_061110 [Encephalitozoon intestinalis ATCC 50506]|uniref:Uncharacterized protein n=1 Tax=Encephalitozoon intestinalis (strain ATCC 50506) TaxID=876142 RepID=E0S7N9_ENCIT|nr:uncharacterized protein Eint_061110 [Encephalitozoon intestinalis ATCC 50506]ADM11718.1 hypothetical protein Eint_061110 [Encephalitozoon intestinalis ATCC 50506]UTX45456.1 hypothetical protein GPK93_06g10100 [Encephalitozoon intestinalis]
MTMEINNKEDENLSSFKRNLRKMIQLEEEAKKRREDQRSRKLVSIRVGKIEGMGESPERKFVQDRKRVFEEPKVEYEGEGKVRERIESFSKKDDGVDERILGEEEKKGFVYDKDHGRNGEEAQNSTNAERKGSESLKIVEECKISVNREVLESGPKYKDEEAEDECFKEISVEDIKKSLLAELDSERESEADIISTVMKSENSAPSQQEVIYVDRESSSLETEKNPYNIGCNVYAYDIHYKISDLSWGNPSGHITPNEKEPSISSNKSPVREHGDVNLEDGPVTYQDLDEEKEEKGWFSLIFESVFSICCGK